MSQYRIQIGKGDLLTQLFSFPNAATVSDTLAATVLYWFRQTLGNDGIDARASIEANASNDYTLTLDADDALAPKLALYADRVPKFLANGRDAIAGSVSQIRADGKWDPISTDPPPSYRPWRFFMPLGMAMVNQKSVQFFHYPPIRLLEQTRNYLEDPVPARCFELLQANGVPAGDLPLYNTVVDGAPIAAEDNQGSMQQYKGKAVGDPTWGLIPINYFNAYQKAQVELLLNPVGSAYTVPIVVYGAHPRQIFAKLYNIDLGKPTKGSWQFVPTPAIAEIIPGRKTPVLSANHPYNFYAEAQGFDTVGSGQFLSADRCKSATDILRGDLSVARWQQTMAQDPSLPPADVFNSCTSYWNDPARAGEVCALVRHEASLKYSDPVTLAYSFALPLPDAAALCAKTANDPCSPV